MIIEKIIIDNFKCFRHFELDLNDTLNILVGDNETGKSTLLEALNLCLTGQLNGRYVLYELSPYLFNNSAVSEWIAKLKVKKKEPPPSIYIEVYFTEIPEFAKLKGTINSQREDAQGVRLLIEFDESYQEEYEKYISNPEDVESIPIEYYAVKWYSFADNPVTRRSFNFEVSFIDTTTMRLQFGSDYYIQKIIDEALSKEERAQLTVLYRKMKEDFKRRDFMVQINEKLKEKKGTISDKELTVSIDISQKTSWESNLTSYLDDIPFQFVGKGEQNILKILIALDKTAKESHLILIEEPENHLSYSTMSYLINKIINYKEVQSKQKQVILSTHSNFVMNKLGIESVIMLGPNQQHASLLQLKSETQDYFKKLPGYDTLRLILAKKAILVEGPSDELIVQKAYFQAHEKLPIEDGIDVISVGLSFKRFLDIAVLLKIDVVVVTDNDGDYVKNVEERYKDYVNKRNTKIKICYDKDDKCKTLEDQIMKVNDLEVLNEIFEHREDSKKGMIKYMKNNKTDCALKLFQTDKILTIPEYIKTAIS
ncbi:MAG: ATP-dependent nuclease [Candidatus Heimdallarchaeaceae archaeon]